MPSSGAFGFQVHPAEVGQRVDALLAHRIPECSRTYAASLIKSGRVTVNGDRVKPGHRVHLADTVEGVIPPAAPTQYLPEPIALDVIYEDRHLIVLNKPAGLVVHPAPGHASGTLVNGLLYHCDDLSGIGGQIRPGIVHRLDKGTSGILVVAKSDKIHDGLARQFKNRQVKKTYLALVCGIPEKSQGTIDLPIGRHPVARKKMSIHAPLRRAARTHWQVQRKFSQAALMRIVLETGRTHQIRVHMTAVGHPVLGDPVYGTRRLRSYAWRPPLPIPDHQMLHAYQLGFRHPASGDHLNFKAHPPADMRELIHALSLR